MSIVAYVSVIISIVALFVSIIALLYTVKTYLLKSGSSIRGQYSICSSIACEDKYISSIILENQKDRAIIIFNIYLRIGNNYFIEIDNFEDDPLILKPFEIFRNEYDPIDFYGINTDRIIMNDLFNNDKVKKKIVLSTSNGRYIVRSRIRMWSPISDFFRNHLTAIIYPMRSTFKGKSYGINAKYIVVFKQEDGSEEVVPIYRNDYQTKKFKNFNLTKESLKSKDILEEFLYNQILQDLLKCNDVNVFEMETWRNKIYEMEDKEVIEAFHNNWFVYYIYGRILTLYRNYKLKKENKQLLKHQGKHSKIH